MTQTLDRDQHLAALQRFREDQTLAARLCLKIQTKRGKLEPLVANRAQAVLEEERTRQLEATGRVRMLVLKARQEGISTWVGGRIYLGCKLHKYRRGMVLADKLDRAGDIFGIYERFERESPELIARPQQVAQRKRELAWEGDSRITVGTAQDTDAGRAGTLWYVHASEFAFWPYPAETLMGLLNAVPADAGEVYIESTANGLGGEFHAMWEAAEAGENGWVAVFLPWWAHDEYRVDVTPGERVEIMTSRDAWEHEAQTEGFWWRGEHHKLNPEQLAFRRRKISDDFQGDERRWRQEYPATPEEAFIATGGAFFDEHGLGRLTADTRPISPERRTGSRPVRPGGRSRR